MTTALRLASEQATEGDLDVREFLAVLARRKWLVLAGAVLAVGLAALYTYTRVPVYTAQADVLVRPILVGPLETTVSDHVSIETESELVTSSSVATLAAAGLDRPHDFDELVESVTVRAPENAQILEISVSHSDPVLAGRGAQAFAEAYLEFKSQEAAETIARQAASLGEQIERLDLQIEQIERQIASKSVSSKNGDVLSFDGQDLLDRREALNAARLGLQNQLASVTTLSTNPGQVIRAAQTPTSPTSPNRRLNLAVGSVAGLLLGLALAVFRERLTARVETPGDVEQSLEVPTLGVVPNGAHFRRRAIGVAMVEDPGGRAAHAYRGLRTKLLAMSRQARIKSLLVTSADEGEGKTTTAANLGVALAQAGKHVTLVSADFTNPRIHALFGLRDEHGLGDVLAGTAPLTEVLKSTTIPRLKVLTSSTGASATGSVDLLSSEGMRAVLEQCVDDDFVIIDGPPVSALADTLVLAELADAVLFVVDVRKRTLPSILAAREQLHQVGARVIGGVANRVSPRRSAPYGPYGYGPAPAASRRPPARPDDEQKIAAKRAGLLQ